MEAVQTEQRGIGAALAMLDRDLRERPRKKIVQRFYQADSTSGFGKQIL